MMEWVAERWISGIAWVLSSGAERVNVAGCVVVFVARGIISEVGRQRKW